jgi:hypothetical protein
MGESLTENARIDEQLAKAREGVYTLHLSGELQRISDRHPAYDPVYFPLLLQHGQLQVGWHLIVRYHCDVTTDSYRVSCLEFVAYRLYIMANGYSMLHHTASLVLREVSTAPSEMRLPNLPGSLDTSRLVV